MNDHRSSESTRPGRVVLLGAGGFIGKNLSEYLNELEIKVIPVTSKQIDLRRIESVSALQEIVTERDAIVFASAVTPDRGRDVHRQLDNLKIGETVMTFLETFSCAQVIYISSDSVYDDSVNPIRESAPTSPATFYGLTHIAREKMMADALKKTKTPLLILRPTALYGSDDTHNSYGPNRFLRSAISERKITIFGNGEEKRDHVHVRDLCRVIGLGLLSRSQGVLNVATGQCVSFLYLAQTIAGLVSDSVAIERLPRGGPVTHRHFDTAQIIKTFPSFQFMSLREGLSLSFNELVAEKSAAVGKNV